MQYLISIAAGLAGGIARRPEQHSAIAEEHK